MCFYENDDYDWYAKFVQESDKATEKPCHCMECNREIAAGEMVHEIFMQEHEECQICEDSDSDSYIGKECEESDFEPEEWTERMETLKNHACEYGETSTYRRCQDCGNLITAIEAVEIEENCPPGSRRPPIEELQDSVYYHEARLKYAAKAIKMFPNLKDHPIVIMMLRKDEEE